MSKSIIKPRSASFCNVSCDRLIPSLKSSMNRPQKTSARNRRPKPQAEVPPNAQVVGEVIEDFGNLSVKIPGFTARGAQQPTASSRNPPLPRDLADNRSPLPPSSFQEYGHRRHPSPTTDPALGGPGGGLGNAPSARTLANAHRIVVPSLIRPNGHNSVSDGHRTMRRQRLP